MSEATTVYCVVEGYYENVGAIFSREEYAEEYAREVGGEVQEWTVDEMRGRIERPVWIAEISLEDGASPRLGESRLLAREGWSDVALFPGQYLISARSAVSREHALEIATQERTKFLAAKEGART